MSRFDFLTGTFSCTSTEGKPYIEYFTRPLGGNWVRATDTIDGKFIGEHTIGYDAQSKRWQVLSAYPNGEVYVMRSIAGRAGFVLTMTNVYPAYETSELTFTQNSKVSYSVAMHGTNRGRAFRFTDTCVKRT